MPDEYAQWHRKQIEREERLDLSEILTSEKTPSKTLNISIIFANPQYPDLMRVTETIKNRKK